MNSFEKWREQWKIKLEEEGKIKKSTLTSYCTNVNKFIEYLKVIKKEDRPRDVQIEDIINCVGFYTKKKNTTTRVINSVGGMKSHIESLKNFYSFLQSEGQLDNIFSEITDFKIFYQEVADKYELEEKKDSEYLEYKKLVEWLQYLETDILSEEYSTLSQEQKEKYIRELGVSLFLRLTTLYPGKRQDICELKINQFEDDYHKLCIKNKYTNGLKINIPNTFRRDLKKYIKQREFELERGVEKSDLLFNFLCGKGFELTKINSWMYFSLKQSGIKSFKGKKKETYSTEAIRNTILLNFVKGGMNPALISKISNIDIGTLEKKYYSRVVLNDEEEIINLEIAKMGLINYI